MRTFLTVIVASFCGAGFLSCKNGAAGRSMENGVTPAGETEGVTEINSAIEVVIPGDGKITIDAYRKDDSEDDFKLAVPSTAITGPNLTLTSTPMKLAETYKCTVTIRKVDRVTFQMVDVLTSAAAACEPLPAPATGFNFKISGVEADSLYVVTLHVVPDSTPNSTTTLKVVLPPMSDGCRGSQAKFTMIADALTNGAANLILEMVKIADTTSTVPTIDAQTTLLHLNLPDLLHFVAGSNLSIAVAAAEYAFAFNLGYTIGLKEPSHSTFDMAVCTSVTGTLLKSGSIAENLVVYTQSTAIQAWQAMIDIAATLNEEVVVFYTIYNQQPDQIDFQFLNGVHAAYETNRDATTIEVNTAVANSENTGPFNIPTPSATPVPSLVDYQ